MKEKALKVIITNGIMSNEAMQTSNIFGIAMKERVK
jgi:hypothetical protein